MQPFTLVEDNMIVGKGITNWVNKIKSIRLKLIGNNENTIRGLEYSINNKINKQFVNVKLPGSSKMIKIKAKDFFDEYDDKIINNITQTNVLNFSRMKLYKTDENVTLLDKDFQKNFLKKYKNDVIKELKNRLNVDEFRFKEKQIDSNRQITEEIDQY